jgi:DNA modification methylase
MSTNCIKIKDAKLINGDSVVEIQSIPSNSIGLTIFSPPFPELYCYSDDDRDMGNCRDYEEFKEHFSFLPPELFRVTMEGRNVCIHCMDTPIQKGKHGFIGLRDFSGLIINEMISAGFIYHSRITIWKNPVTEMQRTKALGLLHKQVKKDSTMSRVGIPDYVLVFRKDGERENPVKGKISVDTWQQYASPVWMDIDQGDTLNGRMAREEEDEKHICPLQLGVIKRLTILYSNEGDTCLTTFGGIGSEPFTWLELNRKAIAIELKKSYYEQMVSNCKAAIEMKLQTALF